MGAAMRRLDWARNPLGAVGKWPSSLRAAVKRKKKKEKRIK